KANVNPPVFAIAAPASSGRMAVTWLDCGRRRPIGGRVTTFRELSDLCERLARTRSRRELAAQVADFLARLSSDEARPAGRLLLGQAGRGKTAVSGATVWRVLGGLVGGDLPSHVWEHAVDAGEAAERLLRTRAPSAEPPALPLVDVEARICALGREQDGG